MSFNTFDFKFCPQCGERLSYTSSEGYCAYTDCLWNTNDFSPAPAQQSQSDSVAAPAEVGQGRDTLTLQQFQRWLEDKAHAAHAEYFNGPQGETFAQEIERCRPITALLSRTRIATELLMLFKLEQGE